MLRVGFVLGLSLALIACSDDAAPEPDARADAAVSDSSGDARPDSPTSDTTGDTTPDLAPDSAPDAAPDAVLDATSDSDLAADGGGDTTADIALGDLLEDGPADGGDADGSGDSSGDADGSTDADTAGDPDISGEVRCGARLGDTCTDDEWCDFSDDSCGATDRTGICTPRPEMCTRDLRPTCGCDGVIHDNPCEGQREGTDMARTDRCPAREGWTGCGFGYCMTDLSYCLVTYPGVPEAPTTYACQPLPEGCGDSPSCECLASEPCGFMCGVQADGGLRLTCPMP